MNVEEIVPKVRTFRLEVDENELQVIKSLIGRCADDKVGYAMWPMYKALLEVLPGDCKHALRVERA